jgi:hypothetical protein
MDTITLTFGTEGCIKFSISSTQNNYEKKNLLPIVIEEDGPQSYLVNIFGADNLESVFPVFTATQLSFVKFEHNGKFSPCIKIKTNAQLSSFPIENIVYGLEILNEQKQKLFEDRGGHKHKNLNVWFGVHDKNVSRTVSCVEFDCMHLDNLTFDIADSSNQSSKHVDRATIALNNSSTERFKPSYFEEPKIMNQRTFNFCFKNKEMMDNLYLK